MIIAQHSRDRAMLELHGALREPVGSELRNRVDALLRNGQRTIVLDLSRLSGIDAAGLGELVRVYNMVAAASGVLQVVHTGGPVGDLLARVGLFNVLGADLRRVTDDRVLVP